ncbi:MAG: OmpA family protein [Gammaproteobacteria bacterium]|nr:MAG: OmpA family protein [Gammaproteobacteria bacterium]
MKLIGCILSILLIPQIVNANEYSDKKSEIITREYKASLSESSWKASSTKAACHISQKIPYYGEIIFTHRADDVIVTNIWVDNPPTTEGYARLYSIPPQWKPNQTNLDLGRIKVTPSQRPFYLKHRLSRRLMKELELGNYPTVYYEDWDDSLDDVKVQISPIGFKDALKKHRTCVNMLDPVDFSALAQKVTFTSPETLCPNCKQTDERLTSQENLSYFSEENGETMVFFDTDKHNLNHQSKKVLNTLIDYIKNNPDIPVVLVTGHTDNIGTDEYNIKLGQKRANSVMQFLVQNGIPKTSIQAMSEGEHSPLGTNKTAKGRAKNRRTFVQPQKEKPESK